MSIDERGILGGCEQASSAQHLLRGRGASIDPCRFHRMPTWIWGATMVAVLATWSASLRAHHEAVLGPQSASVIGASAYAGVQVFTKRTASAEEPQETSLLLSGGISPFTRMPLSFNLTLPISFAFDKRAQVGLENAFVSARFRLDLADLQRVFGKADNYLMFLGGVELPTGNMDQAFGKAPTNTLFGMMSSFELGSWAAMGFVLTRIAGTDGDRFQKGHELLTGGGLAYTPVDDPEQMVSFQLGASYEVGLAAHTTEGIEARSGYERVMMTLAVVARVSAKVQILGYGSLPAQQRTWRDEDRMFWRLGTGIAYFFTE